MRPRHCSSLQPHLGSEVPCIYFSSLVASLQEFGLNTFQVMEEGADM